MKKLFHLCIYVQPHGPATAHHSYLDQQSLNLVLDTVDLVLDRGSVVGSDGSGNNRSGHTTGSAQGGLGRHEHIWHVLVLTQQRQVQQDLDGLGVSGHDDELGDTSVQGLGGLISTLLQLSQVLGLLDHVKDLLGQAGVGQWEGFRVGGHCVMKMIFLAPCSN